MNKRFIIESNGIWDKVKGDEQLTWKELCDVLNELEEENKKLKFEVHKLTSKNNNLTLELDELYGEIDPKEWG